LRLVHPQQQPAAFLERLERVQSGRQAAGQERRAGAPSDAAGEQRPADVLRLGQDAALQPRARVRVQRVDQLLLALLGEGVGPDRRAQQAQAELRAKRVSP
jgi:hypothetical protein